MKDVNRETEHLNTTDLIKEKIHLYVTEIAVTGNIQRDQNHESDLPSRGFVVSVPTCECSYSFARHQADFEEPESDCR